MSKIKPTKAQLFNGLRRRPKYEEISHEINPDTTKIKYPNRDAKFLREDPRMTQLDGVPFFESMQEQEEATIKEQRKETIIRQMAKDNKTGIAEAKATAPAKHRTPEFSNIGHDDAHVQTDEAEAAQGIEQSNIHSKARKDQNKDRAKTHIIKIRTVEHDVMKPGTAEIGTSTNPTSAEPIATQTSAASSASNATQTFPLHAMDTTGNKKQAKQNSHGYFCHFDAGKTKGLMFCTQASKGDS